ncbi:MAG: hypothetical protein JSU68_10940 [Phycisphaerales bacterium]|nr:MAG: hypothetical protein JSU68_10940 [Phycisphaerales bacterium]
MSDPKARTRVSTSVGSEPRAATPFGPLAETVLGKPALGTLVLLVFAVVLAALQVWPPEDINWDSAWYCYAARRVLDGAKPYIDVVDVNPPLIIYLHIPPAGLARALGWSELLVFKGYVCLLALVSLLLSHGIMKRSALGKPPAQRRLLLLVLTYILLAGPGAAFGQREHFLLIVLVPYVLGAAARAGRAGLRGPTMFLVGLLAGLGACLKPYFLPALVVVQVYLLFGPVGRRVWRSPENIGAAVAIGLYAVHFLFLPPEVREAFVDLVRMTALTYGAYERELRVLLEQGHTQRCLLLGLSCLLLRPVENHKHLYRVLLLTLAVLFLAAIWQLKGWRYHFLPALGAGWILAVVLFVGVLQRRRLFGELFRLAPGAAVLLLAAGLFVAGLVKSVDHFGTPRYGELGPVVEATQREAGEGPIAALSILVNPAFPLVNYTGLDWTLRFNCLWLLPGIYAHVGPEADPFPYSPPAEMTPVERYLISAVVADFQARPPTLVFVQTSPPKAINNPRFDFVTFLTRDPEFARIWSRYEFLGRIRGHVVFKRRG